MQCQRSLGFKHFHQCKKRLYFSKIDTYGEYLHLTRRYSRPRNGRELQHYPSYLPRSNTSPAGSVKTCSFPDVSNKTECLSIPKTFVSESKESLISTTRTSPRTAMMAFDTHTPSVAPDTNVPSNRYGETGRAGVQPRGRNRLLSIIVR